MTRAGAPIAGTPAGRSRVTTASVRVCKGADRVSRTRCAWVPLEDPLYVAYHDEEWGVPSHDERALYELLTLEGAQAGLSWSTILHKREGFRSAFAGFDAEAVARFEQ